ncbi:MAG: ABC transporter permease, partial [Candidatus Micrarchaeota archaeon]|nr:ABC transporter permease [Candidatus Micrarchaeota archaeon]
MKSSDVIAYSIKNLKHRQLRSWLTILGIVIGIAAIVSLISISEGLNEEINKQLSGFGANIINIVPVNVEKSGFSGGGNVPRPTSGVLTEKDYKKIKRVTGLAEVTRLVTVRTDIKFKDKTITANIFGAEQNFFEQFDALELETGRFLTSSDSKAVVLGNGMATEGFGKQAVGVNSNVVIDGDKYRVVGIIKKTGNPFLQQMDSAVIMPLDEVRSKFSETIPKDTISVMFAKAKPGFDIEEVGAEVKQEMLSAHHVTEDDKDFSVITPSFINSTIGSITSILTAFLAMISSISLVVGGIGIANSMFMSVMERTKEIGVLKAIGASNKEILSIFLFESGVIGAIGGVIGTLIAILLLTLLKSLGVPSLIKPELVIFSILFSTIIGLVSGAIPS